MTKLGFDLSGYPGDEAVSAFYSNTPFSFLGFYLGPTQGGNHRNAGWMPKRQFLEQLGYGFAIVYVGLQAQDDNLTYQQGQSDGLDAEKLAKSAGFNKENTVIFLDIELGGTLPDAFISYINGWIDYIAKHTIYMPGIYCSHLGTAEQIRAANPSAKDDCAYWVFNVGPSSPGSTLDVNGRSTDQSGAPFATVWQYCQNTNVTLNSVSLNVDLSMSTSANPSNA